jgi:hypothetical protein
MSTHPVTKILVIPLVGNIGELAFPAIAKRTSGDIKLSGTKFCSEHFINFRHNQIAAAVSLGREAQSLGA